MNTLAIILVRAGSKGLPNKCILPLCGKPLLAYTIGHAQQSRYVDSILLTTDSPRAAAMGRAEGVLVLDRPRELAGDAVPSQDVVQHALRWYESHTGEQADAAVVLGGNVPIREDGLIDRCVDQLIATRCDSVRTVVPVGKYHPDWMHRLDGDRMIPYRANTIARRQDLEPLYCLDCSVVVARREFILSPETANNPQAYLGRDCRAIALESEPVDIDTLADFYRAEAMLRVRSEALFCDPPTAGSRRPPFTGAVAYGGSYERR